MPVILDEITVSVAVLAKIKFAMEEKKTSEGGGPAVTLTDAEAKAAFREMVISLVKNDIISYLRDAARKAGEPDVTDVDALA